MKLTVLLDNNTLIDRCFVGEPGVSYFIEDNDTRILFDTGYSDVFISNARKMNIDFLNTDYIVLSHGHYDHTWGLDPLIKYYTEAKIEKRGYKRPDFIAHPEVFMSKRTEDLDEIGMTISKDKLSRHFDLKLTKEPLWLNDKLVFLGEIPRLNDYESKKPIGKVVREGVEEDDYVTDDSAIAYKSSNGIIIITGCSHSGICNIVEHAKKVCSEDRVIDIIGGFHLLKPSKEQFEGTIDYMRNLQPHEIHACHCTSLDSKIALSQVVKVKEVGVGMVIEYV